MSRVDARATSRTGGAACHTRFPGTTAAEPNTTSATRGTSFATVIAVLKRLAPRTPTTLSAASAASTMTSSGIRRPGDAIAGTRDPSASAKKEATAAAATVIADHSMNPAKNPTAGPSDRSTNAYTPPVSETRLPASAKQRTMRPIVTAHTRYAMGAAGPRTPAIGGWQAEDAAADRDVDDARGHPPGPEGADQRPLAARAALSIGVVRRGGEHRRRGAGERSIVG